MELDHFGIKELYEATLKATSIVRIGDRTYEIGEPILYFKHLQFATLTEGTAIIKATGGRGNATRVIWESHNDTMVSLKAGVLTKESFAHLINANVITSQNNISIPKIIDVLLDNNGEYQITETLTTSAPFFVYLENNGVLEKTTDYTITNGLLSCTNGSDLNCRISYYYDYEDGYERLALDLRRFNGVLRFEGKAYYKSDDSGLQKTAIIVAPKVKIISNLQLILGEKADPLVSTFNMLCMMDKVYQGEDNLVIDIQLLDTDIDSDI